jgi:hypothetical protein
MRRLTGFSVRLSVLAVLLALLRPADQRVGKAQSSLFFLSEDALDLEFTENTLHYRYGGE